MPENGFAVCLDVGGTSVKSGVVGKDGIMVNQSLSVYPVDSAGTKTSILQSFAGSLGKGLQFIKKHRFNLAGIGISICGPFDYENGISKIKDLDKYEALYDVNVKKSLQDILGLQESIPFLFDVDAWAFGRGEVWAGAAKEFSRVIIFTMGTGVGSAFLIDGEIVSDGPGVPWYGWISGQKYKDGILNDYISRTYMIKRYRIITGEEIEVREMAERADAGDMAAKSVFNEIGTTLGAFLSRHNLPDFKPECLVFGGQISRAFHLFAKPVKKALKDYTFLKAVFPAADIEGSALKGVAKYIFDSI